MVSKAAIHSFIRDLINEGELSEYLVQDDCGLEDFEYVDLIERTLEHFGIVITN